MDSSQFERPTLIVHVDGKKATSIADRIKW